jgi:hypothetical protein
LHTLILEAALAGLELQRQHIDQQIAQVRSLLRPRAKKRAAVAQAPAKPKRRISLAGRKRIAAAQRKRWAGLKEAQQAMPL